MSAFTVKSVRPVGVWTHKDLEGVEPLTCKLCLKHASAAAAASAEGQGDVVVHTPCRSVVHHTCLNKYFTRAMPNRGDDPLTCPGCKGAWAHDDVRAVNVWSGADL
jgi:hypothetical protein